MISQHQIRRLIPGSLKSVVRDIVSMTVFSDWQSARRYYRLRESSPGAGDRGVMTLKLRPLHGAPIGVRPHSTDARVVFTTFIHRFHLPPIDLPPAEPALILDLGANIGCTIAHFASLYPNARVVGVELDPDNASLCRRNIETWRERCTLVEGAVWAEDGEVQYAKHSGHEDAFFATAAVAGSDSCTQKAISINSLIAQHCPPDQPIDYVKMDIEGAEKDVLKRNTEWAARVHSIKVEVHGEYSKQDCIADLQKLGFAAWEDTRHALCVVGVKKQ